MKLRIFFICNMLMLLTLKANACTELTFHVQKNSLVAHNFDWPYKYAYFVVNPSGIKKIARDLSAHQQPLHWVSRYGSVTINMLDKSDHQLDAVTTGINQQGLTASVLCLEHSVYSANNHHAKLGTAQWAQYFLDSAKNVDEAVHLARSLEITPSLFEKQKVLVHLILNDARGDTAVMEYHAGKLNIFHKHTLSVPVLTNNGYLKSIHELKKYKSFGGNKALPGGFDSAARFVLAANFLKLNHTVSDIASGIHLAFNACGYLIEPPGSDYPTDWSVVYDLSNRVLYYRDRDNQNIRYVRLKEFDFSKQGAVKILLLNNKYVGNVRSYFQSKN